MPAASEPTSCCFVARLGNLDPAVEERLRQWAAASCVEHHLGRGADGVTLYAVKRTEKTARQYQSLLRTLSAHWRLPFGRLERGWLKLMAVEDYRSAVAGASVVAAPASCAEALPPPADVEARCAPACSAPYNADATYILRLPSYFAVRSHALLASLRAQAAF